MQSVPIPIHTVFFGSAKCPRADGSDDPNINYPSRSAIIFVFNTHSNTIFTTNPLIEVSYPGENYAIIISFLYPDLHFFTQAVM